MRLHLDQLQPSKGPFDAAGGARQDAEGALAAAEAEAARAEEVRDAHIAAVENPGREPMSPETMRALGAPVVEVALRKRMERLDGQWSPEELLHDDELAFVVATATELAAFTGLDRSKFREGYAAGLKEAEAEQRQRPLVAGGTVLAPGARRRPLWPPAIPNSPERTLLRRFGSSGGRGADAGRRSRGSRLSAHVTPPVNGAAVS